MFPSLCFVDESKNEVDSDTLKEEIECIEPKNETKTNENKDNNESSNSDNKIKFKVKLIEVIKDAID